MEAEGTEPLALMTVCVFVCVCFLWGFLDEAGLEVGAVAWGATEQQVLLVDQAVQQVFLSVVVIDLQEGQHRDAQPGEPGRPQAELWNSNKSRDVIRSSCEWGGPPILSWTLSLCWSVSLT